MVITALRSVAQIVIWRVFITPIKVNQTCQRAVELGRRPFVGEPSLHFCPLFAAPLFDCREVTGVGVELDDRRTVSECDRFFSGSPTRDSDAILRPLFPFVARCIARLTGHPTFPLRPPAKRPYCPTHAGCERMFQLLARNGPS